MSKESWRERLGPVGLAALRLVIAFIFLRHGAPKAFDPAGAMEKFVGLGLPGFLGPITGWVEVIAATALAAGVATTWSSAALFVVIAGAIVTVQIPKGMQTGLERDLLILAGTLVLAAFGPGTWSVDRWKAGRDRG